MQGLLFVISFYFLCIKMDGDELMYLHLVIMCESGMVVNICNPSMRVEWVKASGTHV